MSHLLGAAQSKDKPVSLALPPRHSSVWDVLSLWVPITLPFIPWVLLSIKGECSPQARGGCVQQEEPALQQRFSLWGLETSSRLLVGVTEIMPV